MQTVRITKALTAGVVDVIAASQPVAGAGDLTLTASPVALDTPRRILFTPAGADAGKIATVYGYNAASSPITEAVTLVSSPSTIATNLDFQYVTRIAISAALAGNIRVGTNTVGSTQWFMPNFHMSAFNVDIWTQIASGSANYNVETTQDDYWNAVTPTTIPRIVAVLNAAAAAAQTILDTAVTGYRLTINSGTGTVSMEATQAGIVDYG